MRFSVFTRLIAFFTILCCIFMVGCAETPSQSQSASSAQSYISEVVKPQQNLRIALSASEGVNPYISNTNLTHQAAGLVFVNMVEISPSLEAIPKALREVDIDGLSVTLTPNSAHSFTDGANITSADITASINAARISEAFATQLSNIEAVEDMGSSVAITLFTPDSLFEYLLALPVIRADEVALRFPTSSGNYSATPDGLTLNENAPKSLPNKIDIVSLSGFDEIVSALGVGEISLYYTETENSSASSTTSLQNFYKLNNLVFLGVNAMRGDNTLLGNAAGRRAISEMLDRQIIADKCYYQRAYPALGAINSFYPCVATKQLISGAARAELGKAFMQELGYEKNALDGYYEKRAQRCEIGLLVYSGSTFKRYAANLIKETLSQNGIFVNIDETDNFDVYKQKIANGEFDMYIGEVKLYNNMDLSMFLNSNEKSAQFWRSEELLAAYAAMRENEANAIGFETVFESQMPYIPLLWRMGTLVTEKRVHGIIPTLSNIFYDMSSLSFS